MKKLLDYIYVIDTKEGVIYTVDKFYKIYILILKCLQDKDNKLKIKKNIYI